MFGWKKDLTLDNIYSQIGDYEIFSYYIGKDFKIGRPFNHPLREDRNPSFSIYRRGDRLLWKDFSTDDGGSSISFVMKKYGITFPEALNVINSDFRLGLESYGAIEKPSMEYFGVPNKVDISHIPEEKSINIRQIKPNRKHFDYWEQYGISTNTLNKYNVLPISHFWIDGRRIVTNNVTFAYAFGNRKYKILQPDSPFKWITNCSANILQGYQQLPESGELLIITSSLKDVMVLWEMGYIAVAPQAESTVIPQKLLDELQGRFKKLILYYNNDDAGFRSMDKYDLPSIHNPLDLPKDPSDLVKEYNFNYAKDVVQNLLKNG
jgi:hypothetical protein